MTALILTVTAQGEVMALPVTYVFQLKMHCVVVSCACELTVLLSVVFYLISVQTFTSGLL